MNIRSAFLLQIIGATVPALVMLMSIPWIRSRLDLDQFAAFTVLLSAVGLLTVLDGGLGRASTYFVSLVLGRRSRRRVLAIFHAAMIVGLLFSLPLGLAAALAVHYVPGDAIEAARPSLLILSGFAPIFVAGSLLRGFLEAEQRFGRSSSLQLIHGTLIGFAPLLVFSVSSDLRMFVWIVGFARVVLLLALLQSCGLTARDSWFSSRVTPVYARRVFDYTKWLFVSNFIGLTIVFADRFFVASLFSSAIVAAYVLPMELIARLQIPIAALCSVLFPRIVARSARGAAIESRRLIGDAQGAILCGSALAGVMMAFTAEPMMGWWLGNDLAAESTRVLIVGIVGVGLVASAALAMLELNGRGLTRPVALLHAVEIPLYLALLYTAARSSSIVLLLVFWTARLAVDAIGISLIGASCGPARRQSEVRGGALQLRRVTPWVMVIASLLILLVIGLASHALSSSARTLAALMASIAAVVAGRQFITRLRLAILAVA